MRAVLLPTLAVLGSVVAFASESAAAPPKEIPLEGVRWSGPAVTPHSLKGKSTIVLVYASWCPKCNVWSEDLFKGLKKGIQGKPIVILAIYADETPNAAQKYVTDRDFTAPNILHGYDPKMPEKLGFDSNLFNYVTYGPSGEVVGRGAASSAYIINDKKTYTPIYELNQLGKEVGSFRFTAPELSPRVQRMLWPVELDIADEVAVTKARNALNADEKAELDSLVEKYLEAGLNAVKGEGRGKIARRLVAYEKATHLADAFKSGKKTASELAQLLEKNETFKHEWAAKRAYEAAEAKGPAQQRSQMKTVATKYAGTHFGRLAEDAGK